MHAFILSDKAADANEKCSVGTDRAEACEALLESHNSLIAQVTIIADLAVKHVTSDTLHGKVELVLPELAGSLTHEVVGPASVLRSMKHVVMLNGGKALLEDGGVEERIECIT